MADIMLFILERLRQRGECFRYSVFGSAYAQSFTNF